jgi:hypothetical protein
MVDTLQDARHEDIFWTIRQIVKRRDLIVKSNVMNKNQLHSQLSYSYPSYRKFFALIDAKSAICFWENYPSPEAFLEVMLNDEPWSYSCIFRYSLGESPFTFLKAFENISGSS